MFFFRSVQIFLHKTMKRKTALYISIAMMAAFLWAAHTAMAQGPAAFSDPGARQVAGGAGGLIAVDQQVDGGIVPIGASAQVVIRFRNEGSQPVQTGLIRLYPSSNVTATISLNQCQDEALAPGAECAIALSVKGLQAGAWRVEMLMSHTGRARLVTATLSGTVEATGESRDQLTSDIEAIPQEVDFGTLNTSQTLVESIILRNITSSPIDLTEIYIDSDAKAGFNLKTDCKKLEPGQACIATISWAPRLRGPVSGVFVVKHNGPTALTSVPLDGQYDPDSVDQAEFFPEAVPGKGLLVSSQTEIDFEDEVQTASTITVSLVNMGDSDLTLNAIEIAGTDNGLSFKEGGCKEGTILGALEACPLTVKWSPTRAGFLLDDITIKHDGARGVLILPVRGESENAVSKDQGAVQLSSKPRPVMALPASPVDQAAIDDSEIQNNAAPPPPRPSPASVSQSAERSNFVPAVSNPASVLDGLKITSFSPTRAIVAGATGSRIVFDDEEAVIGGVPWMVNIQRNGIEFEYQGQIILLLFDRSLSSLNRIQASSNNNNSTNSSSSSSSSSSSTETN